MTTSNTIDRRTFLRTSAAVGAALLAVVAGCATEQQRPLRKGYEGADLGREQTAIVRPGETRGMFNERLNWVRFMAIDGKPLNGGWDGELAVLPGPHTLHLRYTADTSDPLGGLLGSVIAQSTEKEVGTRTEANISFEALAGRSYIVKYKAVGWMKLDYWIEDQASGAVVAKSKPAQ